MSLWVYGLIVLGVSLSGLILLIIFGLLGAAQQGDEYLEQMGLILSQRQACPPSRLKDGKPHITRIPAYPHLRLVDAPQTRVFTRL